jgi:predicted DNA-binding ribbon-helix-helix protein
MQSDDDGSSARARSSTLVNRNVTIRGRRTSLRLEPAMWDALHEIAQRESISLHELCSEVERERQESTLTAAIRVYILGYFREAATPQGHSLAGHGQPRGVPAGHLPEATPVAGAARNDRQDVSGLGKPPVSRRG